MVRISNTLIGFLNLITAIISLAAIGAGLYIHLHGGTQCQKYLETPLLVGGAFLFVVSLFGMIGSWCKVSFVMWIYLLVMFLLIVGIMLFTVFALVVTNKGVGKVVSGRGYKEYRLGDYSNWVQKNLVDGKHWDEIRSCLIDSQICRSLSQEFDQNAAAFFKDNLSPIQSGCCKPPTYCGYEFKNATYWVVPKGGPAVPDTDCKTWSNDQTELCYDCKSCKGGVLANIKLQWRKLAIINSIIFVILVFIYSVGCCAFRNNRRDKYKYRRGFP